MRCNISNITKALRSNTSASESLKEKFKENKWLEVNARPPAEEMVTLVLARIEQDVYQYEVFIAMLRDIEGMDLTLNTLTGMTYNSTRISLVQ